MFSRFINFLENNFQGGLVLWITSFFSIIVVRLFVEGLIFGFKSQTLEEFLAFSLHTTLFFLLTYLVFLLYIHFSINNVFIKKKVSLLLWGFWLMIFPPVIDKIYFGEERVWSFYIFDGIQGLFNKFILFFGDDLTIGITLGTRIVLFLVICFMSGYFYYYKKNIFKTMLFILGAYLLFFILASMPSVIVLFSTFFSGGNILSVTYNNVSVMFLTPLSYFSHEDTYFVSFMAHKLSLFYTLLVTLIVVFLQLLFNKNKFLALVKNVRYPQMFFNWGLFSIGIGLGAFYFNEYFNINTFSFLVILNLLIAILFAWFFSVLINDIFDLEIDKITNKTRPLVNNVFNKAEYYELSFVFILMSLISALVVGSKFFIIIIVYIILTWVYSAPPFRFKRFFPISIIISSFSSLLLLMMGYILISKNQAFIEFPWKIYWFLFFTYCLIIPIKDFKDIKSDQKFNIKTLPILIGENKARIVLASLVFFCYIFSVYIISEQRLFLEAFLFGGISFWVIINKKISSTALNWWLLGLVFVYGLFVVSFMFL